MSSKPRFVGECRRVKLNEICSKGKSSLRQKDVFNDGPYIVYGASGVVGTTSDYQNEIPYVAIVKDGAGVGRANACEPMTSVLGTMQALIPNPNVERDYLLHLVRSLRLGEGFSGSTIPHIYFKDYGRIEVPLPSLEAQKRIVSQLGLIEAQIEQAEAQITQLDQLVKSRFVEMFASGGFPSVSFGDVCLKINNGITRRGNDPDGDIVLRLVELQEGFIDYAKPNRIRLTQKEKERFSLVDGDLLFARVNGNPKNVGRCASFSAINESVYHNDHVIRATFDHSKYNPVFLVFFMNSSKGRAQIEAAITTSAGQYTINQAGIKSIQVPLPPLAFQQEFAAFVSQVDKSRFIAQQQIEKLQMLYDSLAQDYFGD